jgi:hypothetical protein
VAEVQVRALDPHAEQAPDDKKYPELQVVAAVADVQAAALDPQAEQLITLLVVTEKNPAEQVRATVAEEQVAIPVPQEVQTPALRK